MPGLVRPVELARLRRLLALVAAGRMQIAQAGDCAEDPAECTREHVTAKVGLLDELASVMQANTGLPVLRVGRVAGQFAKPRSQPTELVGGVELPVYRGFMVNSPVPHPVERAADALRLLDGYDMAGTVMGFLRTRVPFVWTSHEALLLDYELPMLRRTADDRLMLASTHLPWIGDRTRQVDGAHVRLLATVVNPVACKVGPTMATSELLRLCQVLDPDRVPGRLILIARMGADVVRQKLPSLVRAVRAAEHPVIWLCDPMHANTVRRPDGHKTRLVTTVIREVEGFQHAVLAERGVVGGLHLETTPNAVLECLDESVDERAEGAYTTLCDPRLNPRQAVRVASVWRLRSGR
ncbi:3-deoxy-7-phosphoheptulonate synthase [Kutzneria sp. CA-103260]|nr:3-deoxy-7-phosphoheptulonate synthase [Kutzneria sp. CA-103260]